LELGEHYLVESFRVSNARGVILQRRVFVTLVLQQAVRFGEEARFSLSIWKPGDTEITVLEHLRVVAAESLPSTQISSFNPTLVFAFP